MKPAGLAFSRSYYKGAAARLSVAYRRSRHSLFFITLFLYRLTRSFLGHRQARAWDQSLQKKELAAISGPTELDRVS